MEGDSASGRSGARAPGRNARPLLRKNVEETESADEKLTEMREEKDSEEI